MGGPGLPPPGMPGMPPAMPGGPEAAPPQPGQEGMPPGAQLDPNTMAGAIAQTAMEAPQTAAPAGAETTAAAPMPTGQASASGPILYKQEEQDLTRWEEILERSIERVIERQQRVVLEKVSGLKARKGLFAGTLDIDSVMQVDVWDRQMDEDIKPVISSIIQDSWSTELSSKGDAISAKSASNIKSNTDFIANVNAQMARIKSLNAETRTLLSDSMFAVLNIAGEEERASAFRESVVSHFTKMMAKTLSELAEDEARRAWKFGKSFH